MTYAVIQLIVTEYYYSNYMLSGFEVADRKATLLEERFESLEEARIAAKRTAVLGTEWYYKGHLKRVTGFGLIFDEQKLEGWNGWAHSLWNGWSPLFIEEVCGRQR